MDADETTYSLHIILRFELEQALLDGSIALEDLPAAWRERMRELLGVDVPDDARGVLQDTHWSTASFGYFPTYALGNVISLQIWAPRAGGATRPRRTDRRRRARASCRTGSRDAPLRARAQAHAARDAPRVTGSETLDPQPYLAYLRDKLATLAA